MHYNGGQIYIDRHLQFCLTKGVDQMNADSYEDIRKFRDLQIKEFMHNHFLLNQFHDKIMLQVVDLAIKNMREQFGPAPVPFSFFLMGSAGRFEQAIWSDQDHGIIFEETNQSSLDYFLHLGKEISKGLYIAGYEYCDGNVMASNPTWCKSTLLWEQQVKDWIQNSSWESIRNLLIFIDSRTLYGEMHFIDRIKDFIYHTIKEVHLYKRIFENTMFLNKGIGVLGQFLTETHGAHSGSLNIKEKAVIPYVNAIRFLAMKESVIEASTLKRLEQLSEKWLSLEEKEKHKQQFLKLLQYRLLYGDHSDYDTGHYLNIDHLPKNEKKEIKQIIKSVLSLSQHLRRIVEKLE